MAAERKIDAKFYIELLQSVLYAAHREVAPLRYCAVRQSKGDVDQDFIFGLSEAIDVAKALLLRTAYLAVYHALALDEDAAKRQFQPVIGSRLQDIAIDGADRNDARHAADIGFV